MKKLNDIYNSKNDKLIARKILRVNCPKLAKIAIFKPS